MKASVFLLLASLTVSSAFAQVQDSDGPGNLNPSKSKTHWLFKFNYQGVVINDLITDNGNGTCTRLRNTGFTIEYDLVKCSIGKKGVNFTENIENYGCNTQMVEQFNADSYKVTSFSQNEIKLALSNDDEEENLKDAGRLSSDQLKYLKTELKEAIKGFKQELAEFKKLLRDTTDADQKNRIKQKMQELEFEISQYQMTLAEIGNPPGIAMLKITPSEARAIKRKHQPICSVQIK